MSEISEIEIKSMTKEQNYIRGYEDGKSDVLDRIRVEVEKSAHPIISEYNKLEDGLSLREILQIIDKYKAGSEDKDEPRCEFNS